LFRGPCICGPAYWSTIKERPEIASAGATQTGFHVPNATTGRIQELKGATFLGETALQALARSFAGDVDVMKKLASVLQEDDIASYD